MVRVRNREQFIKRAKEIHGDKYDYSKVVYFKSSMKVTIICPEHGEFEITPNNHIHSTHPQGCKKCGVLRSALNQRETKDYFIDRSTKVHGNKYDYSKVEYVNNIKPVIVICPIHGEFKIKPTDHYRGRGCKECGKQTLRDLHVMTENEFIDKCNRKFKNRFDLSRVKYVDGESMIKVICPEHGEFEIKAKYFLKNVYGCPRCKSSVLEDKVEKLLNKYNIGYIRSYRNKDILKLQHLDFYLNDYNIGIECQGKQHFEPVDFAGKGKEWSDCLFFKNKERDKIKKMKCEKYDIKLYYINYNDNLENKVLEILQGNGLL